MEIMMVKLDSKSEYNFKIYIKPISHGKTIFFVKFYNIKSHAN